MAITYGAMARALGLPEDADHHIVDARVREIGATRKAAESKRLREKAAELVSPNDHTTTRVSGVRLHDAAEAILATPDYSQAEYVEALEQAERELGPEAAEDMIMLDEVSGLDADKVETLRQDYISRRGTELVLARFGVDEETATYQQLADSYAQAGQEFEATLAKTTGKETPDG